MEREQYSALVMLFWAALWLYLQLDFRSFSSHGIKMVLLLTRDIFSFFFFFCGKLKLTMEALLLFFLPTIHNKIVELTATG